jgi:Alw26I/Eco31I/Esp3I family type II restriction m6 adenine DNA methyltransferase
MNHIKVLQKDRYQVAQVGNKTLEQRATGRFYTPEVIGRDLAKKLIVGILKARPASIRICDPFSGDGRLILWVLEEAIASGYAPTWEISVWDIDGKATERAYQAFRKVKDRHGLSITVRKRRGDSFGHVPSMAGQFDVVVSNPPWDLLKPDRRELDLLAAADQRSYLSQLSEYDKRLQRLLPFSQPSRKFGGWGTNLSRVGVEASVLLARPGGAIGLVTPASMFGDQNSLALREWLSNNVDLHQVTAFPAEARLFEGVDQAVTSFSATRRKQRGSVSIFQYRGTGAVVRRLLKANPRSLDEVAMSIAAPPGAADALNRLKRFLTWRDLEKGGLWAGRELDETKSRSLLGTRSGTPFIKGRMIGRYEMRETPHQYVSNRARSALPRSVQASRLAWRDVSRASQKRRAQATVIPAGWVTGNSLGVAYFEDQDKNKLFALLAVFNSLIFEAQIRCRLFTPHISLGVIRGAHLPDFADKKVVRTLTAVAGACLNDPTKWIEAEVAVAKAYGVARDEMAAILDIFPKITKDERNAVLQRTSWA